MVIDKTKGINNPTHWYTYKPRFLIWNRNKNFSLVISQFPVSR